MSEKLNILLDDHWARNPPPSSLVDILSAAVARGDPAVVKFGPASSIPVDVQAGSLLSFALPKTVQRAFDLRRPGDVDDFLSFAADDEWRGQSMVDWIPVVGPLSDPGTCGQARLAHEAASLTGLKRGGASLRFDVNVLASPSCCEEDIRSFMSGTLPLCDWDNLDLFLTPGSEFLPSSASIVSLFSVLRPGGAFIPSLREGSAPVDGAALWAARHPLLLRLDADGVFSWVEFLVTREVSGLFPSWSSHDPASVASRARKMLAAKALSSALRHPRCQNCRFLARCVEEGFCRLGPGPSPSDGDCCSNPGRRVVCRPGSKQGESP